MKTNTLEEFIQEREATNKTRTARYQERLWSEAPQPTLEERLTALEDEVRILRRALLP